MPATGDITLKTSTSIQQRHASLDVSADPGWKILSVGINMTVPGPTGHSFVTACAPDGPSSWSLLSKDSQEPTPAFITGYCFQIYDPDDVFEVRAFSVTSPGLSSFNSAAVTLPPGFTLVGGGAYAHYSEYGQFIVSSKPTVSGASGPYDGWFAASKDHMKSDPGSVTAFAVGIRMSGTSGGPLGSLLNSVVRSDPSPPSEAPSASVALPEGYALCGGGIDFGGQGAGNLATGFYPAPDVTGQWIASGHDSMVQDLESVTAYAIGLNYTPAPRS